MKKIKKLWWIPVALIMLIIPLLINIAFKYDWGIEVIRAEWNAGDALSFYGAFVGSAGAIILGVVAWNQNKRLLSLEEKTFLANNVGSAVITEIEIKGANSTVCNYELHEEQIIFTENANKSTNPFDNNSISVICKLKPFNQASHIALVHVKSLLIFGNDNQKNISNIYAAENEYTYSKVAISENYDRFKIDIIMSKDEKEYFVSSINNFNSSVSLDIELMLLTDKYVLTELKCRADLFYPDYDDKEKIYSHFKTVEEYPPMCFWNGASIESKENVVIKTVAEE